MIGMRRTGVNAMCAIKLRAKLNSVGERLLDDKLTEPPKHHGKEREKEG